MRRLVVLIAVVGACGKKHEQAAPVAGSAGSAVVAAPVPAAGSGLVIDEPPVDDTEPPDVLRIVFGGKIPRTPAVSADGTLYAEIEMSAGGLPEPPMPYDLVLHKVGSDEEAERITLFDYDEGAPIREALGTGSGSSWKTPALEEKLAARGAAALKKLAGFHSLTMADINWADDAKKPVAFGADTLVAYEDEDSATVELRDASGRVLHRATVDGYTTGSDDTTMCSYVAKLWDAGTDGPMLYVSVGYRYRDDCMAPKRMILAWSLDPAKGSADDAAEGMIAHQLEQPAPVPPLTNRPVTPQRLDEVQFVISHDGKSGWASGVTKNARASDVLVKTPAGWQIVGAAWTASLYNGVANEQAKTGKLVPRALDGGPGDAALADAFKKLMTDGVDATAAKREDLVAIGSGPDERTVGGAGLARAWNAAWKGKVTLDSLVAKTTPSGTTGWVTASVRLQKAGYAIPFLIFAVFDKTDAGWSLVHIHFAV